jgi:uncharacterized protein (DUF2235 family)
MGKNIVLCCDGTGNQFGRETSNVVKLYRTLDQTDEQFTYYHPGVGTLGAKKRPHPTGKVVDTRDWIGIWIRTSG